MTNPIELYEFTIRLTLQGPILTKSTSPASFGVDAAVARDFLTGKPSIPGSLLKGKIAEAWEQLGVDASKRSTWIGKSTEDSGQNIPQRAALVFGDLIAEKDGRRGIRTHRVAIDAELGSAAGEMLQVIEVPFGAGEKVSFSGVAYGYAEATAAQEICDHLKLGLASLTQVGALRTTGFGKVLDVSVDAKPAASASLTVPSGTIAIELTLRPKGPLCVSRHKIGGNLFESEDFIPGNVLAGAVAQTAEALGRGVGGIPDFDKIRFSHCFPTTGPTRPQALPLSTVKVKDKVSRQDRPFDIAHHGDPVLIDGMAPAFPIDWKDFGELAQLGWASPARQLRVRTAIDSEKRTADRGAGEEGGLLFAMEVVHPATEPGGTAVVWRGRIDVSAVADPRQTAPQLALVLARLGYLSKTKVRCEVDCTFVTQRTSVGVPGQSLVLTLQTPALLADPRFSGQASHPESGAISAADMTGLYREVWHELSCGSLELRHAFAQQYLAGGEYLARRFQYGKSYDPWLLTVAGSVFVFEVKDSSAAQAKLESWVRSGLPIPNAVRARFGAAWNENPYRPENGFGEITEHASPFQAPPATSITRIDLADPVRATVHGE